MFDLDITKQGGKLLEHEVLLFIYSVQRTTTTSHPLRFTADLFWTFYVLSAALIALNSITFVHMLFSCPALSDCHTLYFICFGSEIVNPKIRNKATPYFEKRHPANNRRNSTTRWQGV